MTPERIAAQGRAFAARVITLAVVSSVTVGVGVGLILGGALDPFGARTSRAIERANDATAIAVCISRDAFEQRLDGLEGTDGDVSLRNLREVLEDGLRRYDVALELIDRGCDAVPNGDL